MSASGPSFASDSAHSSSNLKQAGADNNIAPQKCGPIVFQFSSRPLEAQAPFLKAPISEGSANALGPAHLHRRNPGASR